MPKALTLKKKDKDDIPSIPLGGLVDKTYTVLDQLGKGKGGGVVYRCRYAYARRPDAAFKYPATDTEIDALEAVHRSAPGCLGVPPLHSHGVYEGRRYYVTQALGCSLTSLLTSAGIREMQLNEKWTSIRVIGRMLLRRLEALHRAGWVHGDVAPDNFLFGRTEDDKVGLFLIDFGCARCIGGAPVKAFWNTVEFAACRMEDGCVREPYDDLESLGYILMHGMWGNLPWFQWTRDRWEWEKTRDKDIEKVKRLKRTLLMGQFAALGVNWFHLTNTPRNLVLFLVTCMSRPKAKDRLPVYEELMGYLEADGGPAESAEAGDLATLTEACQDMVRGCPPFALDEAPEEEHEQEAAAEEPAAGEPAPDPNAPGSGEPNWLCPECGDMNPGTALRFCEWCETPRGQGQVAEAARQRELELAAQCVAEVTQ